jgi:hypothetical protein
MTEKSTIKCPHTHTTLTEHATEKNKSKNTVFGNQDVKSPSSAFSTDRAYCDQCEREIPNQFRMFSKECI